MMLRSADLLFAEVQRLRQSCPVCLVSPVCWPYAESTPKTLVRKLCAPGCQKGNRCYCLGLTFAPDY